MAAMALDEPQIITLPATVLVGLHHSMCLEQDSTRELWQEFMSRRHEIKNPVDDRLYNLKRFAAGLELSTFTPRTLFEKWAAQRVHDRSQLPAGMEVYDLAGGDYAVFLHRGQASAFDETQQFIFTVWLPASPYQLDQREHFEILLPGYRPDDPQATEEVWIPIRPAA
jgi:AraC family transcriptional regulator